MESGLPACVQVSVGNESQQVQVQQQYQQQVMVPVSQSVQGPMPVYYSVITPTQQTSTRYKARHVFSLSLPFSSFVVVLLRFSDLCIDKSLTHK